MSLAAKHASLMNGVEPLLQITADHVAALDASTAIRHARNDGLLWHMSGLEPRVQLDRPIPSNCKNFLCVTHML